MILAGLINPIKSVKNQTALNLFIGFIYVCALSQSLLSSSTTLLILFTTVIWSIGWRKLSIANQAFILIPGLAIVGVYFLSIFGERFNLGLPQLWLTFLLALSTSGLIRYFHLSRTIIATTNRNLKYWFNQALAYVGAILWGTYYLVTRIFPTHSSYSWVMSGDTATFLADTGEYMRPGGLNIMGAPVASPSLIIGFFASGASLLNPDETSLQSRVTALSDIWAICIVLMSITISLLARAILLQANTPRHLTPWIAGVTSLIPLSWVFSGYAVYFGFFGSTIVICLLLVSFLAYLNYSGNLSLQLLIFVLLTSATFLVWIPLAIFPAGLFFANVDRQGLRYLFFSRSSTRNVILSLCLVLLLTAIAILPYFASISGGSALGSGMLILNGAALYFRPIVLVGLIAAVLFTSIFATGYKSLFVKGIYVALSIFLLSFVYMVIVSGKFDFPWMYYPSKYAWLALLFFLPLFITSAIAVFYRLLPRSTWLQFVSGILIIFSMLFFFRLLSTKGHINIGTETSDIFQLVTNGPSVPQIDRVPSNIVAQEIFSRVDQNELFLLWGSGDVNEGIIDFWILKNWNSSENGNYFIGDITYGLKPHDATVLCELGNLIKQRINVMTIDQQMMIDVGQKCPNVSFNFVTYKNSRI